MNFPTTARDDAGRRYDVTGPATWNAFYDGAAMLYHARTGTVLTLAEYVARHRGDAVTPVHATYVIM